MTHLALIGCGKMGKALLRGWLAADSDYRISVYDPAGPDEEFAAFPVRHYSDPDHFDVKADIYILAVKPQIIRHVCEWLAPLLPSESLVISIAAGMNIALFQNCFGLEQPILRAMPNTPAAIGKGVTALVGSDKVLHRQRQQAESLLGAVGKLVWLKHEALMDPATAISGSGPAYLFHMIEALTAAGVKAGLSNELSTILARETIIGAAALADREPETPAAVLRQNVTSPGGTTEAALHILMDGRLQDIYDNAVDSAAARSRSLSGKPGN